MNNIHESAYRTPVYVKLEQFCLGFFRKESEGRFYKNSEETGS
jgi:hypothetical protein